MKGLKFMVKMHKRTRMKRTARLLAGAALAVTLAGCSWFGGSDRRNDPVELTAITPTVNASIAWRASVGSGTSYGFAPAIVGEAVYAAARDGKVVRVDAQTGNIVWSVQAADRLSAGVGANEQTVAVVTPQGMVIALDAATGQEQWRTRASSEVSVVPWVGRGVVVVRAGDYRVQAFNAANGERIWNVQRPGPALALRAPARMTEIQEFLLSGMPGGRLLAIEPGGGAVVWEGVVAVPRGASDLERVNDVVGMPIVRGDYLCAVAYQGRITCFNAEQGGRTIWANNFSSVVGMGGDDQRLVAPDNRSRVAAYELKEGTLQWRQDGFLNRQVTEPAVLANSVVFGDFEGYVHVLSAQTGEPTGRLNLGGGAMMAPVQVLGNGVLVQTGDSNLAFLRLN
jgi:outer membrane protein assembly factor BamB